MLTPEQKERRRQGIGSSDAAACCGLDPWRTPLHVYLEKKGLWEAPENDAMRWGTLLEPVIAHHVSQRENLLLKKGDVVQCPRPEWLLATPDYLLKNGDPVEIKTTRSAQGWGEEETDAIPEHYLLQVQHQLMVLDRPEAHVYVLIGGQEVRHYLVRRNVALQVQLLRVEGEIWRRICSNDPPPIDYTDPDAVKLADTLYRPREDQSVELGEEAVEWAETYHHLAQQARALESDRRHLKARLIEMMGHASRALLPGGWEIHRKIVQRKGYHVEPSEYVQLTVKEKEID